MSVNVEQWIAELHAAGWRERICPTTGKTQSQVWICPNGYLWRGPYGAWCEMHKRDVQAKAGKP